MKGTLLDFARKLFGKEVRSRLRPSYFPFTEPSAEMDIECFVAGRRLPYVNNPAGWNSSAVAWSTRWCAQNGVYDPQQFSGSPPGLGIERIALLRHRITDHPTTSGKTIYASWSSS
jgi:phenylalanyl-tRNA synthetase alpha chain